MNIDTFITIVTTSCITSSANTITTFFVYRFLLKRIDKMTFSQQKVNNHER